MRSLGTMLVATWLCGGVLALPAMSAPSKDMGEAAQRDGNAMYEAFRVGRLDDFATYTYPGLLKLMGGKKKMIALLEKGRADMEKQGFRFVSGVVAAPIALVEAGTELHALLPLNQVLTAPGGALHAAGHLLGISSDGGKTWTFIDAANLTPETVRQVLPNFNPQLKLPRNSEPKFIPKS